jgi:hypothetical protein
MRPSGAMNPKSMAVFSSLLTNRLPPNISPPRSGERPRCLALYLAKLVSSYPPFYDPIKLKYFTDCFYHKDNKYYYAGVYIGVRLDDLSQAEWFSLPHEVKNMSIQRHMCVPLT